MQEEHEDHQVNKALLAAKFKWVLIAVLGIAFLLGAILLTFHIIRFTSSTEIQYIPSSANHQESMVTIDVQGAVMTPGVVRLPANSRLEDAIAAAGGLSADADQEYIRRQVNLAAKAVDGTKLYIPYIKDVIEDQSATTPLRSSSGLGATEGQVNINQANSASLEALPGIGPVTAEKIIANRPYGAIEELVERKIVGKATFEKIKEKISVY